MTNLQIVDNFFREALAPFRDLPKSFFDSGNYSIYEKGNQYFVELAVAGLSSDDISVNLDKKERILKVEAKKVEEEKEESDQEITWYHKGVQNKNFVLRLPDYLKLDQIEAKCVDGKLTVSFEMMDSEEIENINLIQVPILGNKA